MARWNPAYATPTVKLYSIQTFRSVAPGVFLAKILFFAFSRYHGNPFLKFLAHVLNWLKNYHHTNIQKIHQRVWPE